MNAQRIDTTDYSAFTLPPEREELAREMRSAALEILDMFGKLAHGHPEKTFEDDYLCITQGGQLIFVTVEDLKDDTTPEGQDQCEVMRVEALGEQLLVEIIRPGLWCQYIRNLRQEAAIEHQRREDEAYRKLAAYDRWRFAPVDVSNGEDLSQSCLNQSQ